MKSGADVTASNCFNRVFRAQVEFASLRVFAHRPTVACVWRAKDDCFGVPMAAEKEPQAVALRSAVVGEGGSRLLMNFKAQIAEASLTLVADVGRPLALLSMTHWAFDIRIFPVTMSCSASLGNLRIANLQLPQSHPHHWFVDLQAKHVTSLLKLEMKSFLADGPDYPGYDYSVVANAHTLRVIYLHAFVEEYMSFFHVRAKYRDSLRKDGHGMPPLLCAE